MNYFLNVSIKTSKAKLGCVPGIVLDYTDNENQTSNKMLNSRGVDHQYLIRRRASKDEVENETHPHRESIFNYNDWDKLIKDEMRYTSDQSWFDELSALRIKYPKFQQKQESIKFQDLES